MNWMTANYMGILAVVGAIYGVARCVVVLTPTPNDDAAVEKYGGSLLRWIGKIVGLDLTQGYSPSKLPK